MTSSSRLTLAVAGSRKTQGIVDACAAAPKSERILVLTYTSVNQAELRERIAREAGDHPYIEVVGWFSFLIHHFVRPFLPFMFDGERVHGFDFDSPPQQYAKATSRDRYLNRHGEVRKVHLPQLAVQVEAASQGSGISRLARLYDRVFIDEVQDLGGYDLEVLKLLMASGINIEMVGDIRQAVLLTNDREPKHKQYKYMRVWDWYRAEAKAKRLTIEHRSETWRCRPEIAAFADELFGEEWGFEKTVSKNSQTTDHDGVYLVEPSDAGAYIDHYQPLVLRDSANSFRNLSHDFMNFRESKGLTRKRVLIFPTKAMEAYISKNAPLTEIQSARLYVAATRAEQSVGIVMAGAAGSRFETWLR